VTCERFVCAAESEDDEMEPEDEDRDEPKKKKVSAKEKAEERYDARSCSFVVCMCVL
jgi:hypothetical protein